MRSVDDVRRMHLITMRALQVGHLQFLDDCTRPRCRAERHLCVEGPVTGDRNVRAISQVKVDSEHAMSRCLLQLYSGCAPCAL